MELAFEYAILASTLLLVVAAVQWKWSRRRALALGGLLTGVLTAVYSSIDWGGPGDAAMGRGLLVMYGTAASILALVTAGLMFIFNPPKPADDAERELGN